MRLGSGIRREAVPESPRPDHSDGVRTEASKHLLKPVMGKFSRNIWFGGFRRSDVGIAAG